MSSNNEDSPLFGGESPQEMQGAQATKYSYPSPTAFVTQAPSFSAMPLPMPLPMPAMPAMPAMPMPMPMPATPKAPAPSSSLATLRLPTPDPEAAEAAEAAPRGGQGNQYHMPMPAVPAAQLSNTSHSAPFSQQATAGLSLDNFDTTGAAPAMNEMFNQLFATNTAQSSANQTATAGPSNSTSHPNLASVQPKPAPSFVTPAGNFNESPPPQASVPHDFAARGCALDSQRQRKANPPAPGQKISHKRIKTAPNRIGDHDWYDRLPVRPTWRTRNGRAIRYSQHGVLGSEIMFNAESLEDYILGCRANNIPLRLWIQEPACMHNDRYLGKSKGHRCIFEGCRDYHTINRGHYQVSIDEYPAETSNGCYDPFHVAGFMHLYCLEQLLHMPYLMSIADVQPDTRDFPLEERNPMSLMRDGASRSLLRPINTWKRDYYDTWVHQNRPVPRQPRLDDAPLWETMMKFKVDSQPNTRKRMRDNRNGLDIAVHLGNLDKMHNYRESHKRTGKSTRNGSNTSTGSADLKDRIFGKPHAPKRPRLNGPSPVRRSARIADAIPLGGGHIPLQSITYQPAAATFQQGRAGAGNAGPTGFAAGTSRRASPRNRQSNLTVYTDTTTLDSLDSRRLANIDFSMDLGTSLEGLGDAYSAYTQAILGESSAQGAARGDGGGGAGPTRRSLEVGTVQTPRGSYPVDITTNGSYSLRATGARMDAAFREASRQASQAEGVNYNPNDMRQMFQPNMTTLASTPIVGQANQWLADSPNTRRWREQNAFIAYEETQRHTERAAANAAQAAGANNTGQIFNSSNVDMNMAAGLGIVAGISTYLQHPVPLINPARVRSLGRELHDLELLSHGVQTNIDPSLLLQQQVHDSPPPGQAQAQDQTQAEHQVQGDDAVQNQDFDMSQFLNIDLSQDLDQDFDQGLGQSFDESFSQDFGQDFGQDFDFSQDFGQDLMQDLGQTQANRAQDTPQSSPSSSSTTDHPPRTRARMDKGKGRALPSPLVPEHAQARRSPTSSPRPRQVARLRQSLSMASGQPGPSSAGALASPRSSPRLAGRMESPVQAAGMSSPRTLGRPVTRSLSCSPTSAQARFGMEVLNVENCV